QSSPPPLSTIRPSTPLFRSMQFEHVEAGPRGTLGPLHEIRLHPVHLGAVDLARRCAHPLEPGQRRSRQERPVGRRIGQRMVCPLDRKSTRLNSSHVKISYAV